MAKEQAIGTVSHYYDQAGVAVIKLDKGASLKKGESVHFKGANDDFTQEVTSLQVDHKDVEAVKAGMDFGLKVDQKVHEGTKLLKAA